ncbi:MAG: GNAT family N-acetyltransferase [Pseudomonadota bacterium]
MSDIKIRQARLEDIPGILDVEEESWPEHLRATEVQFVSRIETFPEGTLVAVMNGTIVGVVATEIVNYRDFRQSTAALTWDKITDQGFIKKTHNPSGDTLYGVDISVSRFAAGSSSMLLRTIGRMTIRYGLKRGMLGARIPRYHKYADRMGAEQYVGIKRGNGPADPELMFYKKFGLEIIRVIPNYIKDPDSCDYGVLLVWENPFYGRPFPKFWSWLFRIK